MFAETLRSSLRGKKKSKSCLKPSSQGAWFFFMDNCYREKCNKTCHAFWSIDPRHLNFLFLFFFEVNIHSRFYCLHHKTKKWHLELYRLALCLCTSSQFKIPASLNSQNSRKSAAGLNTIKSQHNILCSFSLFPENGLSLPMIATWLPVIALLSLGIRRIFAHLILCHFVGLVLHLLQKVWRVVGTFAIFVRVLWPQKCI